MNNINDIHDYMFALRVTLEIDNISESNIINDFKEYLYDLQYSINETNDIIYDFYIKYKIYNITKEYIDSIIIRHIIYIRYFMIIENNDEISTTVVNNTLEDSEFNKLNKIKLNKNLDKTCNICLEDMVKNNKIIKLGCDHCFHEKCISVYLKKYNCICPICKYEIKNK